MILTASLVVDGCGQRHTRMGKKHRAFQVRIVQSTRISPPPVAAFLHGLTAASATLRSRSGCERKRSDFCGSRRRSHQCARARPRARQHVGSRRSRARSRTSRAFSRSRR